MTDHGDALTRQLAELAQAIDADRGVTLYLDDGEGSLLPVARSPGSGRRRLRLPGLSLRPEPEQGGALALIRVPNARAGVLLLERTRTEHFTVQDRSVARLFARKLAEQPSLGAPVRRAVDRMRLLECTLGVATDVLRSGSEAEVTSALCRGITSALECDAVTIHVVGPSSVAAVPVAALVVPTEPPSGLEPDVLIALGNAIFQSCVANDRALLVSDLLRDARNQRAPMPRVAPEASMLSAPIRDGGRTVGAVGAFRAGTGKFQEPELALLETLAEFAGGAIMRAREHEERDRQVNRLAVLLEIQEAGAEADDDQMLAAVLASRLADATGTDVSVISRWDEAGTALRTLACHGVSELGQERRPEEILELPQTRRVLLEGAPAVIQADASDASSRGRSLLDAVGARTLLLLPLVAAGKTIGLLELYLNAQRVGPDPDLELCTTIAHHVGGALENARLVGQLRQAADIDQLTGVATHRHLQERVRHEIARSARAGTQFAVLMVDLDGFKGVNDRHGHADGNRVLRNVAAGIKLAVRASDIVARYGGDEFVVLMPDTGERAARVVARRVVSGVSGQRHQLGDGSVAKLTCSVGLAVYPDDGRTAATLLKVADEAMYEVKDAGGRDVRRGSADRPRSARVPAEALKGR